ncbi:MAG TPA: tRNA preQ1(34) S-adenosylmethionine ribosyltransferase-isomerase QueA [Casimicrobiaceae bacterium]|nr:tRNA preQ1(34) S-adenosylmethionine ribosyltransferase-isomerase QueA [Casimicrobiaceae bacterium]
MQKTFTLSDFDYQLPRELIAQAPSQSRSASRMLDVDGARLVDRTFAELSTLLDANDVAVFNDTRVIRARILGKKPTRGRVEMLIERIVADDEAWVQLKASHLPAAGGRIDLPGDVYAEVLERDARFFRVRFRGVTKLIDWLEMHGEIPLPPYIERAAEASDRERYQTVYARDPGAVAAPTAGLHFDEAMLDALKQRGVERAFVTLHVGAGTFQPVASENLAEHRMHSERYTIPEATVAAIQRARRRRGRVIAIGTTTLRALESAAGDDGSVRTGAGETTLFITPGYRFRVVDMLLTNFHLPRSTLLMLVSAFAGHATIGAAYAHAIAARYRFFSYGDAMLLRRSPTF